MRIRELMVTSEEYTDTLVISVVFFALLLMLVSLQLVLKPDAEWILQPSFVAVALVPFIIFLAVTDRLEAFGGGGFEVKLREQAKKTISPTVVEDRFDLTPEETQRKASLEALHERDSLPTTLIFELWTENYYEADIVEEYLNILFENPEFRYVIFNNNEGKFQGYMYAETFEKLAQTADDVIAEIESGKILSRESVNKNSITRERSNQDVLNAMDEWDVVELAVVDEERRFIGVITQEEIVRDMLTRAFRDV